MEVNGDAKGSELGKGRGMQLKDTKDRRKRRTEGIKRGKDASDRGTRGGSTHTIYHAVISLFDAIAKNSSWIQYISFDLIGKMEKTRPIYWLKTRYFFISRN